MENLDSQDYNELREPSSWSTAINYGLIGSVTLAIFAVVSFLLNLRDAASWISTVLSIVIFIVFVFWAIKAHRDRLGSAISFGKAFGVGMLTVLIMAVLGSLFNYVYLEFIDPSVLVEAEQEMKKEMAKQDISREEMDEALGITKMFLTPVAFAIAGFLSNIVLGAIIALIGAAIYQREN